MDFKHDVGNDCAFHIEKKGEFCISEDIVDKIITVFKTNDKEKILEETKCDTEVCVLNNTKVIDSLGGESVMDIIRNHYKPTGPRDSNNWFSNSDIDSVLQQIQKKYTDKSFLHINFQMIDFEKTQSELALLNWPKMYKEGYRTFGTVFNTDTSRGGGKHWFSIYASFLDSDDHHTIEYFNSSGELPMDQISKWIKRVKHEWQPHFKKPIKEVIATRIVNQQDNWNCGSYSLYYIISRLDGTPYDYFKNNKIGDHNMQEFRKFLFRK